MVITEYNEETYRNIIKRDAVADTIAALAKGSLIKGNASDEVISSLGISREQYEDILKEALLEDIQHKQQSL